MLTNELKNYKDAIATENSSLIISTMRVLVENSYKEVLKKINITKYNEIYDGYVLGQSSDVLLSKMARSAVESEIGSRCFTSVFKLLNPSNHVGFSEDDSSNLLSLFSDEFKEIIFYVDKYLGITIPNHNIDPINNNIFYIDYYNTIANLIYEDTEGLIVNKKNMYYFVEEVKVKISSNGKIFFENIARAWYQSRGNKSTKITFYSIDKLVASNCYTMDLISVEFAGKDAIKFLYGKNFEYKIKPTLRTNIERVVGIKNLKVQEFDNLCDYLLANSISLFNFLNFPLNIIEEKYNKYIHSESKNARSILDELKKIHNYINENSHGRLLVYFLDDEVHDRLMYEKLKDSEKYSEQFNPRGRKRYSQSGLLHTGICPFDNDPIIFNPSKTKLPLQARLDMVTKKGYQRNIDLNLSAIYYTIILIMDESNNELLKLDEDLLKKINIKLLKYFPSINNLEELTLKLSKINEETKLKDSFYKDSRLVISKNYISTMKNINSVNEIFNRFNGMVRDHSILLDADSAIDSYKADMSQSDKIIDVNKIKAMEILKKRPLLLVNGAAGTGKSLLLKYISQIFCAEEFDVYALAHTNSAKENLEQIIPNFATIETTTKFIENYVINDEKKLVIILDEAGVVPNDDIRKILSKEPDFFIIAGDYFQLPAIEIGNWFETLCEENFADKVKLENNYRANNSSGYLNAQWNAFRERKTDKFVSFLKPENFLDFNDNQNPFEILSDLINNCDASIISLGYSGIFGVNNCNYIIQQIRNPNYKLYHLNCMEFKVGDKIVFDSNSSMNNYYYNNLKGTIIGISESNNYFKFQIETFRNTRQIANPLSIDFVNLSKCEEYEGRYRVELEIKIDKYNSDAEEGNYRPPFHVAYANSIHKSQGLEYEIILVITSPNLEDMNFNILYTAITRAKEKFILLSNQESFNKNLVKILEENPKSITLLKKLIQSRGRCVTSFIEI